MRTPPTPRARTLAVTVVLATAALTTMQLTALAHPQHGGGSDSEDVRDAKQHDPGNGHLPGSRHNVRLVGETALKNVEPEKIADVSVHKGYAYAAAWGVTTCKHNGVHVVDLSNLSAPREVAFVPSKEGSYPGEGVQATAITTPAFRGDLLVTNNEKCNETTGFGGLNIYDITNPQRPTPLAVGIGDTTAPGEEPVSGEGKKQAHSIHSVFAWDAGERAYAAIVDNDEAVDVDIMDITDPRQPFLTAEYDLLDLFPSIAQKAPAGLTEIFLHDMVVKEVGGRFRMAANYWDAGYLVLDVTDVKKPVLMAQSDYALDDPQVPGSRPEGNAHQSEWTKDHTHLIGTDEDFAPFRSGPFTIDGVEFPATSVGGGGSSSDLPDTRLNGRGVYGGYGCSTSAPIPAPPAAYVASLATGEEKIAILQRGPSGDPSATEEACFPGEKAANAKAAGYDAVVLTNRHTSPDGPTCGSGGYPAGERIPTLCTSHAGLHALFGQQASFTYPDGPRIGDISRPLNATSVFDGWGYVHLFQAERAGSRAATLRELDTYAVAEANDPKKASGFGDLSVHEVATSVTRNDLAYYSYYAAGMRVTKIVNGKLVEVGRYVDQRGSDFWGVEAFVHSDKKEYFIGSDRNFGLQVFEYTGG